MTEVLVLGAGMVGISTALALQARGHDCVVLDRRAPGQETSFGNAGLIQAEASEPYALPWKPWDLARMAMGHRNAAALSLRGLVSQGGAISRYWWHSLPAAHRRAAAVHLRLILQATAAHEPLIDAAGAGNIVHRDGYWEGHRNIRDFELAARRAEALRSELGIPHESMGADALHRAEPSLRPGLSGAIHWQGPWWCSAPGDLVAAYARLFAARGGRIERGDATTLEPYGRGWRAAGIDAARVVVALGPWSPDLLGRFGYRVPMVRKRGHHVVFDEKNGLRRPLMDAGASVVMSPMRDGLRMTTGADLSDGAAGERQIDRGIRAVRTLLPVGMPKEESRWAGTRPFLPHMLPIVREAPPHRGLWLNFGCGHQGFTLGPVTAQILAQTMEGDTDIAAALDRGIS